MRFKTIDKGGLKVAAVFFALSFLWIFFSDRILFLFFKDASQLTSFQTLKGWFYITTASILIFYLVNREISKKNALLSIINKNSEWQNLLISNIPDIEVLLFDHNPGFILTQGRDIVLNKSSLQPWKNSENILFKPDGRQLKFSEIKKKILGGEAVDTLSEYNGKTIEIIGRPVFDDQQIIVAGLLVFIDSTKHTEILNQLNEEKKNYEALFKEYHAVNLELTTSYEKLSLSAREINDSKERYEAFLMQTTEGVYRVDLEIPVDTNLPKLEQIEQINERAYLAECNPVFSSIYGFSNYKEIENIKPGGIKNSTTSRQYGMLINVVVENNYVVKNYETKEPDSNNNDRYFLNNIIGIIDNNKLYRLWGIKTDITKLKKYEAELIAARKQAEKSDQLKSAFLANMSHEIRTPLNGIIGFSELLCHDDLADDQKLKYQQIVKTSTAQLLRIIEDILDISRIETSQLSIANEKFHLNVLISELEVYLAQEVLKRQKRIETRIFKYFENNSDIVYSDKQRLYQVISNLLNNAIKFTEKGTIELGYTFENNSELHFFVKDTGIGIAQQEQDSIFQQFKQVEKYVSRKYGGTGLGLSISKGIVELLGGKISVHSLPGQGSTFSFFIPLIRD